MGDRDGEDIAMLTGNIGRRGVGVNPLRGQNNVQGSLRHGRVPTCNFPATGMFRTMPHGSYSKTPGECHCSPNRACVFPT